MNKIEIQNPRTEQPSGLYEQLEEYCSSDAYPFHMPGHKRNATLIREMYTFGREEKDKVRRNRMPYGIDITEIDGFDNLHHAEGILLEAQQRAASLYGAYKSFYLINGSTCGILAAIFACTTQKGKLLMARNCHKAVYHAVELRELETVYLYPESDIDAEERRSGDDGNECTAKWKRKLAQINGSIRPGDVEEALTRDPQIQAVVITSPTYDGILSDVEKISEIAHAHGVPLIVDEAHGAHFGFHPNFPENALKKGADIVIHSLHKTLPSMTQTALLHIGEKSTKWTEYVKKYLDIFETSSPSYVFMAGMDQCMRLIEAKGKELFEDYSQRLHCFKKEAAKLPHIHLLTDEDAVRQQVYETDPGKLVIAADGWNGHEVAEFLRRKEHLEVEMEASGYVIALTSIADTDEGFKRLKNALIHIEENISTNSVEDEEKQPQKKVGSYIRSLSGTSDNEEEIKVLSIAQATACEHTTMDLERSIGEISGEYIYLYPPGIPLVVPGERITEELLCQIREVRQTGLEIQGMRDYSGKKVDVCRKV